MAEDNPSVGTSQVILTKYLRVIPLRAMPDANSGEVLKLVPKGASTYSRVMKLGMVSLSQIMLEAEIAYCAEFASCCNANGV